MPEEPNIVAPKGELDLAGVRALGPELAAAAGDASRALVVDLSDVTLMDSSALGAVVQAHLRLRRQGRPMAVVAPPGSQAAALLDVTRMKDRLPIQPSRDAAMDAVRR
ncbi:MAG: STAS domain-containing protein [Solirubrobacterales bacterium]|nr:STAS domain-containing protein [Solirubrobacterales bacterium]